MFSLPDERKRIKAATEEHVQELERQHFKSRSDCLLSLTNTRRPLISRLLFVTSCYLAFLAVGIIFAALAEVGGIKAACAIVCALLCVGLAISFGVKHRVALQRSHNLTTQLAAEEARMASIILGYQNPGVMAGTLLDSILDGSLESFIFENEKNEEDLRNEHAA